MNRKQARKLIEKYQQGRCTPDEEALVERWLAGLKQDSQGGTILKGNIEEAKAQNWVELRARLHTCEKRRSMWAQPQRYWPYAAAIVLLIGAAMLLLPQLSRDRKQLLSASEIMPGHSKAELMLADGRSISLDTAQAGIVMGSGVKYRDGTDLLAGAPADDEHTAPSYMLTTPRGGTYQVTLADGTNVWLNANSKLVYPVRFEDDVRKVMVEGEAYFEVKPSRNTRQESIPFVVHSGGQTVTVLGTAFNVRNYADEEAIQTTLVEGRVQVSNTGTANSVMLDPGEQAIFSSKSLAKQKANIHAAVAWKEGRFDFDAKDLKSVMNELARWYDIEVVYEGEVPQVEFFGGIYRNNNLATVLKILESSQIGYRMEPGPKLVITRPDKK
ncbi:FecR family protein [Parapedobacter deserti]|uniref:FecR family protein n=1 Tax=Parapedobacter deserti TaxID=1912957 RepID=A0ABV7JN38_9SPHI